MLQARAAARTTWRAAELVQNRQGLPSIASRAALWPSSISIARRLQQTSASSQNQNQDPSQNQKEPPRSDEFQSQSSSKLESNEGPSLASQYLAIPEDFNEPRAKPKQKRSLSTIEKRRRMLGRVSLAIMLFGAGVSVWYQGRPWETEREVNEFGEVPGNSLSARATRAQIRIRDLFDYFNKPAFEPLLPSLEGVPQEYVRPYTLLLELDSLLVSSTWDREHGWRTAKRPGVDYFLEYLSQFYEIVIFTTMPSYVVEPICLKLDPFRRFIMFQLYRDATRYKDGQLIKDLSYLGRDLSKVVLVDTDPNRFRFHKENGVALEPWQPGKGDKDLVGMIPFLEALFLHQVSDVRPIIRQYEGAHVPTKYAEVESKFKQKMLEDWKEDQEKKRNKPSLVGAFGSFLGFSQPAPTEPKLPIEILRERAQQGYVEAQREFKAQEADATKAMEEDKQRQLAETRSILGLMPWAQPPPPERTE